MTVVYADTSALLKRVVAEPESAGVRRVLAERVGAGDVIAASSLAWLEVWRSLRRAAAVDLPAATTAALSGVVEIPLTEDLLVRARAIGPAGLRSLDAVHLTSAVAVGATAILGYDLRLTDSAALLGLEVLSPQR